MRQILFLAALLPLIVVSCGDGNENREPAAAAQPDLSFLENDSASNPYLARFDSMPDGGLRLKINSVGPLARVFNDSNYVHIAAAEAGGITPIDSTPMAWHLSRPVVRIESCRNYFVDEMIYSLPYLVPEARDLLDDIGRTFIDTLNARGGGFYRVKVTSALRTPATISRLPRRTPNAVDTSAHSFGTTFDISYAKFICDSVNVPRTQEDLKNLLGEILEQFRRDGRCYVKYERKQGCFHITARK